MKRNLISKIVAIAMAMCMVFTSGAAVFAESEVIIPGDDATTEEHIHSYGAWIIEKYATCTEDGYRYKVCECGEKVERVDSAKGHRWREDAVVIPATYASEGIRGTKCMLCPEVQEGTEYAIPKLVYEVLAPKTTVCLYGHDDVELKWTVVGNCAIYYKKASESKYKFLGRRSGTSIGVKNLTDGVKYQFKIIPCIYSDGEWYNSTSSVVKTIYTLKKLNKPTLSKKSNTYVRVKWRNISGETGYQISKSTKKAGTSIVSTYKTTTGNYKNIKATKGKTYYYKVRAYKVEGNKKIYGPWSAVTSFKLK